MGVASPSQISFADLDAARARVPSGAWAALSHLEQLFVAAYLLTLSTTEAARRAGYSLRSAKQRGHECFHRPRVQVAITAAMTERVDRTLIDADQVLQRWWQIANADPNALVRHRRTCCRYCHGTGHEFQRTPAEMRRDRATFEEKQTKRSTAEFDEQGGDGFDRRKDPHPECPECFGEGEAHVFIADTGKLTGAALLLYAGVKETDRGIEVKLRDQDGALSQVARHLGMFAEKAEAPEDVDARAARLRAQLDAMDAVTTGTPAPDEPKAAA